MDVEITRKLDIQLLKETADSLNLEHDDLLGNVYMPKTDCQECGGFGVKAWDGNDSVLCECIIAERNERDLMNYGLLRKLSTLTKDEIYG